MADWIIVFLFFSGTFHTIILATLDLRRTIAIKIDGEKFTRPLKSVEIGESGI